MHRKNERNCRERERESRVNDRESREREQRERAESREREREMTMMMIKIFTAVQHNSILIWMLVVFMIPVTPVIAVSTYTYKGVN